jgi:hypothetical protein
VREVNFMKKIHLLIPIMAMLLSGGCGQNSQQGDVHTYNKSYPSAASNPQVKAFNDQLGEIKDEESASKAVDTFINYVEGRMVKTAGSAQISSGSIIRPELARTVAAKEAAFRVSVAGGAGIAQTPLLNVGAITDSINQLGSTEGVHVNDETVTTAMGIVEESIPNIKPAGRKGITPLGAMVVGYAIVSGDDGTASVETISLPADKMNAFVEDISK